VVWTALPALIYLNLPLDLIEALVYGREWQIGYDKLPPLPWWVIEFTHRLFGPDLFYYALSQVTLLSAFALVWLLGRRLAGAAGALAAILIIDGLHYFQFTSPKFNHDVIQLPFWALAGFAYWAALRERRMLHWVMLGVAIGMAAWAKYFVVSLALPMAAFAVFDRDARHALATPGPYVACAVSLAIMAPHLVWLVENDFLPFGYAEARARQFRGAIDYLVKPPQFLLSQLLYLLPSLLIASPYLRNDESGPVQSADAFDRRIVALLAFGPAITVVLLSYLTGRDMIALWGYPLWLFFGLWIVLRARPLARLTMTRIIAVWGIVFVCFAAAFAIHYGVQTRFPYRYVAAIFPGKQLGLEISRRFRAMTGQPVRYVIASMWVGGNTSHYAPEQPRVLIDGNPDRAPWIDLADLRAHGAAVVWTDSDPHVLPAAFRSVAEDAEVQPPFDLPMRLGPSKVTVGWAVLRPRPVVVKRAP
jgi:hypothetical protein